MAERYGKVLEQYELDVYNTYKSRGALMAVCQNGQIIRVSEYNGNCYRIQNMAYILDEIKNLGFDNVETILKNKEDSYITIGSDRASYIATTWFDGRECDVTNYKDILKGCMAIAKLHNAFDRMDISNCINYARYNIYTDFSRHLRELRRIQSYLACKINKAEFEQLAYYNIQKNISSAEIVVQTLIDNERHGIINIERDKNICHGNFSYHNLINMSNGVAITGFEKIEYYVDIWDFYNFLRKVMEKNGWDINLGTKMIQEYNTYRHITNRDYIYLKLLLAYPEKFWKIINYYYNNKKVWIPEKNTEKLNKVVHQTLLKNEFIKTVFNNVCEKECV